ncbi:MAG: ATP-dependent Clp protease proteolytic subunit [Hallerella porci]|uniref:ATP-dependent Clp protease proteolytic subunit n=1 Tax=Hallerella porci TaxID=1945871 RepID=A0ABX5LK22_9BACT|nr:MULTISPECIES: ATP-dependent Clp protease proteolytic subunit [Hallerella]MCI5601838.1 ATP-dependent Clp protease proteolytic subunit [Hallerella sp.]MDY3921843.1 ATP-dependent Clp protease proteolytic subunit [Hallerella porci]PWK95587.1 ATP-dependent Clp protease protease subunit [Hallerella porci]
MNAAKKTEKDQAKEQLPDFMKKAEEYFSNSRKVFLWNQVDDESAEKIVKQLIYLDSLSHDDITFYINSPGGVISSGLAIYDCMNAIQSDVVTVCCGQAASMGAVLLTAGAKGKRYAWPSARIMIHQPLIQGQMEGPASDIKIQAEEMLRIRSITSGIIAKTTGKTAEEVDRDTERDNFMSAEEAKAYGLVDEVKSIL